MQVDTENFNKMVSRLKRSSYASNDSDSSSEEFEYDDIPSKRRKSTQKYDSSNKSDDGPDTTQNSGRRAKCFTRNAVMARENRLKKKLYLQNLEEQVFKLKDENRKLHSVINNQSSVLCKLRKEVKYVKSVLANSSDISRLIRNVQHSTGMSVTSSLDKTLTLRNDCVSKRSMPVSRKTAHPWEEDSQSDCDKVTSQLLYSDPTSELLGDVPTPDSLFSTSHDTKVQFPDPGTLDCLSNCDFVFDDQLPFLEFPLDFPDSTLPILEEVNSVNSTLTTKSTLMEHNYTAPYTYDEENADVGVCLHVSKHRVSLEFCATCNDNAFQTWKDVD